MTLVVVWIVGIESLCFNRLELMEGNIDIFTPIDWGKIPSLSQISRYFNSVGQYRGGYFVEMKRQLVVRYKYLWTQRQIGMIVNLDHSTVAHHSNHSSAWNEKLVRESMSDWITNGLYPISFSDYEMVDGIKIFRQEYFLSESLCRK